MTQKTTRQALYEQIIVDTIALASSPLTTGELMQACDWPTTAFERNAFSRALTWLQDARHITLGEHTRHGVRTWQAFRRRRNAA